MRKVWSLALAGLLLPAGWAMGQTTRSWEYQDGRWIQTEVPTTAPVQDETLDRVEEMLRAHQALPAKRIVLAWIRTHKNSPIRDRALYLLGQANFMAGNRLWSFYNFDELLDLYPTSRYFYPALQRQYDIADAFLRGYKRRFLGMAILGATDEATEILYRIQQRAPGSPLAEKALLRAADYYYASGDFDIAADAYAAYARAYPRSPLIPRVRLRQAFSTLAQFRGVRFDATAVIDARQQLVELMQTYPRVADEENIPAILQRIDAALAKKLYETADFYRRTHKRQASAYYYQYLIKTFPTSPEAALAQSRLADLPASAKEVPTLPTNGAANPPATNPATPTNPESR